ncbi:hypothetical protein BAE44_0024358 [Dichanthelium oligosanthes]|uniref:Endonuclease/exonuclease/phosphatase domain-containing protein n=1 Tax=Dichanthelium oligosanthes TaxID=888268 RepID=A0A1E5UP00_9POAL|nr:hypothetical protein BAE44_0024358 [Dichanthelium oligosanthes]
MATLLSPPAAPRLALLLRRLNPNPKPSLHLRLPRMARAATSPSRAMSSPPNLRLSSWDSPDDPLDFSAVAGAAFLPLRRRTTKRKRAPSPEVVEVRAAADEPDGAAAEVEEKARPAKKGNSNSHLDKKTVKIMTYNVWFREDLELVRRMNALGNLIQHHSPDLICFQVLNSNCSSFSFLFYTGIGYSYVELQEITPDIYLLFEKSDWWKAYKCSLSHEQAMDRPYYCMQMSKLPVKSFDCKPFSNSHMGRELCTADVIVGRLTNLVLATSHLESPCPGPPTWDQMFSKERVGQANECLRILGAFRNVILCGDMNWDDKGDGPFPLPQGWIDAWAELKLGEDGWTYDTKANLMLSGNRKLQKRLDRFVCKLLDFKVDSIEMIGMKAIPGITYIKEKKVRQEIRKLELPVLPSDHFGLVLTISNQSENI